MPRNDIEQLNHVRSLLRLPSVELPDDLAHSALLEAYRLIEVAVRRPVTDHVGAVAAILSIHELRRIDLSIDVVRSDLVAREIAEGRLAGDEPS